MQEESERSTVAGLHGVTDELRLTPPVAIPAMKHTILMAGRQHEGLVRFGFLTSKR